MLKFVEVEDLLQVNSKGLAKEVIPLFPQCIGFDKLLSSLHL